MTETAFLPATHIRDAKRQRPEMWVQEALYGHRFTDEQKPFMLVLEALAICRGRWKAGDPMFPGRPAGGGHEMLRSYVIEQKALRFLLFWRSLDRRCADSGAAPAERLDAMISTLEEDFPRRADKGTFAYLHGRVRDDPDALVQAIEIVRGSEINSESKKRPQSRFLNPQGPSLHLTELNNAMSSSDRRFFARGGELVYLMLNRSAHRDRLAEAIAERLLEVDDPIDTLARQLSPEAPDERTADAWLGYLPAPWMKAYDRLAEDWLAILDLRSLPRAQLLDPLARVTALNLVRYFAEVGEERFGLRAKAIPLDMSDGGLADIRKLGKIMLVQHREAIREATRRHIDERIEGSDKWQACVGGTRHPDRAVLSDNARAAIRDALDIEFKTDGGDVREPAAWREHAVAVASDRKRGDPASVVKPLAEAAGFASGRQRIGSWFCASDAFLEALVHARVAKPMTLEAFVAVLHDRYGLVTGPAEAVAHLGGMSINEASFRRNLLHLEERLAGLGLLKRLSDDCAFVTNPFAEEAPS